LSVDEERFVVLAPVINLVGARRAAGDRVNIDRQGRKLDLDGFHRVLGRVHAFGNRADDHLPDMGNAVDGEAGPRRTEARLAAAPLGRRAARYVANPVGGVIRAGQDIYHPWQLLCRGDVELRDISMGVGRAQKHRMAFAAQLHVVGIAPLAGQQPRRFSLGYRLANRIACHGGFPVLVCRGLVGPVWCKFYGQRRTESIAGKGGAYIVTGMRPPSTRMTEPVI
jgi:hypothetical protein